MRHKIVTVVLSLLAGLLVAGSAGADPVQCTQGDLVRKVSVIESRPGHPVPCEVRYNKVTEGDDQTPWRAEHDGTFCQDKAASLVTRLESLGWQCRTESNTLADSNPAS